jgi:hypothetical protein
MRGTLTIAGREANPDLFAIGLLLPLALSIAAFISSRRAMLKLTMLLIFAILMMAVFLSMSRADYLRQGSSLGLVGISNLSSGVRYDHSCFSVLSLPRSCPAFFLHA